jgi:ribosomal protein S18 acetylase RimI-like enzyme
MMQTFLKLAKEKHCEEVWLCTERENLAARKLYESLNPNDVGDIIGYTFKG